MIWAEWLPSPVCIAALPSAIGRLLTFGFLYCEQSVPYSLPVFLLGLSRNERDFYRCKIGKRMRPLDSSGAHRAGENQPEAFRPCSSCLGFLSLPAQSTASSRTKGKAWKLNSGFGIGNSILELNCLRKHQAPSPSLVYLWSADSNLVGGRRRGQWMC